MTQDKTRVAVTFAAIDPYIAETMPKPTETKIPGRDFVEWGTRNLYPYYLLELYNSVPTLRTIINGTVDYIAGDDIAALPLGSFAGGVLNRKGDTIRDQVRDIARDYEIYGGFALQVIRAFDGSVAEVYYIDLRFLRCDDECGVFRYSEKWDKGGRREVTVYPAFRRDLDWAALTPEERDRNAASILYVKNEHTQTYPSPLYAAAVKDCELERNITDYHLNALESGFVASAFVNFNNGTPTDEVREEIERDFNEKFSGHQNAGRIGFSWNRDKDHATEIIVPEVKDFGEKYRALSTHARQQIFASFRAVPALFGIMTESTGFNEQEFAQAFRLYNRTMVRPVQRIICDAYDKIYGRQGSITITPFSVDGAEAKVD